MNYKDNEQEKLCPKKRQTHVHEAIGSVKVAEPCRKYDKDYRYDDCYDDDKYDSKKHDDKKGEAHNHRFCTVSGEGIPKGCSHVHQVKFRTDFYEDHYHEFCGISGEAIPTCDGRHVHFLKGCTTVNEDHRHDFMAATLIEDPIGDNRQ